MVKRKFIVYAAGAGLSALLLSSCGGGGDSYGTFCVAADKRYSF